jgi:squalene-hopene/tetraprenyl-beta-curcumene cyclase
MKSRSHEVKNESHNHTTTNKDPKPMRKSIASLVALFTLIFANFANSAVDPSLKLEAESAIDRGVKFLLDRQMDDGAWLAEPAITALCAIALHNSDSEAHADEVRAAVANARKFILRAVQPDGSFVGSQSKYVNYTTSICLAALATINNPEDEDLMRQARHFIIAMQLDEDNAENPTLPDNQFYGGIGYGSRGPTRPDLSNTQWALEALYLTDHLDRDSEDAATAEKAWANARDFLKAVQNVPGDADPTWIVDADKAPEMDGGFVYQPDESKAGEDEEGALRSYGSMTYAGLKSLIYADLDKDDYRVKAAVDWAARNYTLDENPGMGAEGHYYYLQGFAKALDAYGAETLTTVEGKKRNWREDLVRKLLELQKGDGSWFNEKSGRWQESIPDLVTAYSLISLEVALED